MIEPEVDEERFAATQRVIKLTALRPSPLEGDHCGTCLYYLEPDDGFSYCWQEKLQILVGSDWWCHFWEMREQETPGSSDSVSA